MIAGLSRYPMTVLALAYTAVAVAIFSFGIIDETQNNVMRLAIAGFLLIIAGIISAIFFHYLKPARRGDWRGLLPKHVAKVTAASVLTILWVCMELWSRTAGLTYLPPAAYAHAGAAATLWFWSLSDVLRFERRRPNAHGPGGSEVQIRSGRERRGNGRDGGRRGEDVAA